MKDSPLNKNFNTTWRYERKGVIREYIFRQFIDILHTNKLYFTNAYPDRRINNLYFDFVHLGNYLDHVNGSYARQKMRIRWYDELSHAINPTLEFKIKQANVGNKLRFKLNSFELNSQLNRSSVHELIKTSIDAGNSVVPYTKRFYPNLINSYVRSYFLSADNQIRVTVDRKLKFGKFSPLGNHRKLTPLIDPLCIVEIKYNLETLAKEYNLDGLSMNFLQKYSKYLAGMQHVFHLDEY